MSIMRNPSQSGLLGASARTETLSAVKARGRRQREGRRHRVEVLRRLEGELEAATQKVEVLEDRHAAAAGLLAAAEASPAQDLAESKNWMWLHSGFVGGGLGLLTGLVCAFLPALAGGKFSWGWLFGAFLGTGVLSFVVALLLHGLEPRGTSSPNVPSARRFVAVGSLPALVAGGLGIVAAYGSSLMWLSVAFVVPTLVGLAAVLPLAWGRYERAIETYTLLEARRVAEQSSRELEVAKIQLSRLQERHQGILQGAEVVASVIEGGDGNGKLVDISSARKTPRKKGSK